MWKLFHTEIPFPKRYNNDKRNKTTKTIDGVVVRTLFVGNIPSQTPVGKIKQFFSCYGTVKNAFVKGSTNLLYSGKPKTWAFVTFQNPEEAQLVLKAKYKMYFEGYKLFINEADSWHQPAVGPDGDLIFYENGNNKSEEMETDVKEESDCEEESEENNERIEDTYDDCPINKLNDDCLLIIFQYIDFKDRHILGRVCPRWRTLMTEYWSKFKKLDFDEAPFSEENLTSAKLELYLRLCPNITSINISKQTDDLSSNDIALIASLCKNLEELTLGYIHLDKRPLALIAHSCRKLKKLSMTDCTYYRDGEMNAIISKCNLLESISISNCSLDPGTWLKKLPTQLKSLSLMYCDINIPYLLDGLSRASGSLTELSLISLCTRERYNFYNFDFLPNLKTFCLGGTDGAISCSPSALKDLTHLEFENNRMVDDHFINEITNSCPDLTILNVAGSFNPNLTTKGLKQFTDLVHLTRLNFSNMTQVDDGLLKTISKRLKKLQELTLCACSEISDISCKSVVTDMPSLEILDVSMCSQVTDDTIITAMDAANVNKLKSHLTIYAIGTQVDREHAWDHPKVTVVMDESIKSRLCGRNSKFLNILDHFVNGFSDDGTDDEDDFFDNDFDDYFDIVESSDDLDDMLNWDDYAPFYMDMMI